MIPATYDIELYRGDTYRKTFRIRTVTPDGEPGDYFDLTGCEPLAQVRSVVKAPTILQEFDAELLDQTDPDTVGAVRVALTGVQTADLPDNAVWDIQLTHPTDDVHTYLAGKVTAKGQVTF